LKGATWHTPFHTFFLHWFQTSFSTPSEPKKAQNQNPKQPDFINICKKSSSKRTHSQDLQKDSVWRGQTSEIGNLSNTFSCFPEGPELTK